MSSSVRASPFRETEWDRRFNNLMDDLENSAAANMKTDDYAQSQNYSQQQKSSSQQHQSKSSSIINNNNSNYLSSSSTSGLAPDNVLKDLNSALNASSNYIENHRTETGPGSLTEVHEYKTYSTSVGGAPDFDLQEKVQHMMPSSNLYSSSINTGATGVTPKNGYSPLQSANMVSSLQQQNNSSGISSSNKTAFSSLSKVQNSSSSYKTSSNTTKTSSDAHLVHEQPERPGSRLKQNIEELDTLLYDLNNAQKMSDTGADYTASSITPGQISSDDYSFSEGGHSIHHQDKARHASNHAFNEYSTSTSEAKPPSPSPRRRFPSSSGGVAVSLASPASVKKAVGHNLYQTTTTTTTKTVREHSPYDYQRSPSTTPLTQDYRSTPTSPIKNLEYHKSNQDYSRTTTLGSNQDYSRTTTLGSNHDGGLTSPGGTSSDYGRTTPIPVVHEYNTAAKGNQDHISRSGVNQEFSSRSGFNQQEFSSRTAATSHQTDYGRNTTTSTLQSDASRGISPGRDYTSSHRVGDNATSDYSRSGTMPSTSGIGDGSEPKGAAYYAKYHSSHTHKSQQQHQQHQTHSFPTSGRNTPSFPTTSTQQPPKRVDELMTELSEFDSSIQPTNFIEPRPANKMAHTTYIHREDDTEYLLKKENNLDGGDQGAKDGREPMPNIAGPAVYYPPGEMFVSETARDSASAAPLNPSSSSSKKSKGRGKGKSKDKGKSSDSEGKQGAAVVPICLPLCCAAPCVIM